MEYHAVPFDNRVKENIKNYELDHLFPMDDINDYLKSMATLTGVEFLLTDRHGEKAVSIGNFAGFTPDVVKEPGQKIRVVGRTIAHLYTRLDKVPEEHKKAAEMLFQETAGLLSFMGESAYLQMESAIYIDEMEDKLQQKHSQEIRGEKEDVLTGVYHKTYFYERMKIIDRAEVAPVAVINVNINDWKYVNDNYGDTESDRLIKTIAGILKEKAKPDYVIGRVDGDVFIVLVPMPEGDEAESYCRDVQEACLDFEDDILAPSVACGVVYKTNVEEEIEDKLADAEYEMFNNKFEIKNAPGYRERLEKGKH